MRPFLALIVLLLAAASASAQVTPAPPSVEPDTTLPLLTQQEVVALVLAQNPTLAIARLEAEIAEIQAAPGAVGLLPSAALGLAQRRTPPAGERDASYTLDLTASAQVPIFAGGARRIRLDRLRTLAEVAALDAEAVTQDLLAAALVTYFDVARQQQNLLVLREAVALSEERLRIAAGRREAGAASELEVTRAEVDLNADRAALLRQTAALAQARARLNALLDLPAAEPFRAQDEAVVDAVLAEDALAAALAESPDLRAARLAEEAAALEARAVQREIWPRIDLSLGYGFADLTDPILRAAQTPGFTYGLTATFDLFDGFDRRRRAQIAELRRAQQTEALSRTDTALRTALESTYALYESSLALVELEAANAAAARRNAAVALERFRLGASSSLELREVQRALIDAESRLVLARFEAKGTETELRALAGLLPAE